MNQKRDIVGIKSDFASIYSLSVSKILWKTTSIFVIGVIWFWYHIIEITRFVMNPAILLALLGLFMTNIGQKNMLLSSGKPIPVSEFGSVFILNSQTVLLFLITGLQVQWIEPINQLFAAEDCGWYGFETIMLLRTWYRRTVKCKVILKIEDFCSKYDCNKHGNLALLYSCVVQHFSELYFQTWLTSLNPHLFDNFISFLLQRAYRKLSLSLMQAEELLKSETPTFITGKQRQVPIMHSATFQRWFKSLLLSAWFRTKSSYLS